MQAFSVEKLKQDLQGLANQVAAGDSREIQIHARRLAEDLEKYGKGMSPGSITSREIAEQLRKVELSCEELEVAAPHLKEALRIFRGSELYSGTTPTVE